MFTITNSNIYYKIFLRIYYFELCIRVSKNIINSDVSIHSSSSVEGEKVNRSKIYVKIRVFINSNIGWLIDGYNVFSLS